MVYYAIEINGLKKPMTLEQIRQADRRLTTDAKAAGYSQASLAEEDDDAFDPPATLTDPQPSPSLLEEAIILLESLPGYIRTTIVYLRGLYHA